MQPPRCPGRKQVVNTGLSWSLNGLSHCPITLKSLGFWVLHKPPWEQNEGSQSEMLWEQPPCPPRQTNGAASPDALLNSAHKSVQSEVEEGAPKCEHMFQVKYFKVLLLPPARPEVLQWGNSNSIKEVNFWVASYPVLLTLRDSTQMFFLKCKGIIFLPRNGMIDQASFKSFHLIHLKEQILH